MVSTRLKNTSQVGSFPQVWVKIKHVRNHQLDKVFGTLLEHESLSRQLFERSYHSSNLFQPCKLKDPKKQIVIPYYQPTTEKTVVIPSRMTAKHRNLDDKLGPPSPT